jgi:hypothetical protein
MNEMFYLEGGLLKKGVIGGKILMDERPREKKQKSGETVQ